MATKQQTAKVSEEAERRYDLYKHHVERAWTDQQASSDDFDKHLLTFSSGALGLSLAFIKDIVPLNVAQHLWLLYLSWIFFTVCIVVTLGSFLLSEQAHKVQAEYLRKYYIEENHEFLNKKNIWANTVRWCAIIGGGFFLAGLIATLTFAYINISRIHP